MRTFTSHTSERSSKTAGPTKLTYEVSTTQTWESFDEWLRSLNNEGDAVTPAIQALAAMKSASAPGSVPSSLRTGETKRLLLGGADGRSEKLKLPALSWPGHELRSIRTVRVEGGGVAAYVVSPQGENTPD